MAPVLFVNPRAGGGKAADVADRARALGIEVVDLREGAVEDAVAGGADVLGVAGGDGSLAGVASVARAHDLPFACVPAGTRNHFAHDMGVRDVQTGLAALTDGAERRIDVGEVNGRLFLNNVSLGVYGEAVARPEYRDAKARTFLATLADELGPSGSLPRLDVTDDRGRTIHRPAVVLVSNNPYAPGGRPRLDGGVLGVVVAPGRAWTATRFELNAPETLRAGIDGEAVELEPPLAFVVCPRALRVRVPR